MRRSAVVGFGRPGRAKEIRACPAKIRQLEVSAAAAPDVAAVLGEAAGYLGDLAEIIDPVASW